MKLWPVDPGRDGNHHKPREACSEGGANVLLVRASMAIVGYEYHCVSLSADQFRKFVKQLKSGCFSLLG